MLYRLAVSDTCSMKALAALQHACLANPYACFCVQRSCTMRQYLGWCKILQPPALTLRAPAPAQLALLGSFVFPDRISERLILCAEIMYNRTSVGVVYDSSAPCPYPGGPCSCINGSAGTSVHTCKPWAAQRFPFGSEFAFDTTGQEEVYVWARQAIPAPCL